MKLKLIVRIVSLTALLAFTILSSNAQESDKVVTVTSSSSGKTQDEAQQKALRGAIEQAFGAFISSKTEILNDQLVSDQITSITNGNIQSFQILNETQLPDSSWASTLKVLVSVNKLTKFVEAKGVTVEIKGGLFALNIKQQMLNEQGELNTVINLVSLLHEQMQSAYDYTINSGTPQAQDADNKKWAIPLFVKAKGNKNFDFCANYLINTFSKICLSPEEVSNYKLLGKSVFTYYIIYKDKKECFYFRKNQSIVSLAMFYSQFSYYQRGFIVNNGLNEFSLPDKEGFVAMNYGDGKIEFEDSVNFEWKDKLDLAQIEKIQGYAVKPAGLRSQIKNGGLVFYESDGHGLVVSLLEASFKAEDIKVDDIKETCNQLQINGFKDWYLPTFGNYQYMYESLFSKGLGGFFWNESAVYLTSSNGFNRSLATFNFYGRSLNGQGTEHAFGSNNPVRIRLIRRF